MELIVYQPTQIFIGIQQMIDLV